MAEESFDTLGAARSLQAAGIGDEQAAAIVGAIRLAVSDLVTVERFDAGLAELRAHTDARLTELQAHSDTRLTELRAHIDMGLTELRAHIDTGLTELRAHTDTGLTGLRAQIDTGLTGLRAENARARLALAGFIIGANALMLTVAGFVLTAVLSV